MEVYRGYPSAHGCCDQHTREHLACEHGLEGIDWFTELQALGSRMPRVMTLVGGVGGSAWRAT
jgi:hypothetical protein